MNRYVGQSVAEKLGDIVGLDREDKEVIAYGLEQVISNSVALAVTLLAGFFLGILPETLAILFCLALMRRLVGGAHCSTPWRCAATTCLMVIMAVLISKGLAFMLMAPTFVALAAIWTLIATWRWAPNDSEKKPITDPVRRRQLRRRALTIELIFAVIFLMFASTNGLYQSVAVASAGGMAVMAVMVSPVGHVVIGKLDKLLGLSFSLVRRG